MQRKRIIPRNPTSNGVNPVRSFGIKIFKEKFLFGALKYVNK